MKVLQDYRLQHCNLSFSISLNLLKANLGTFRVSKGNNDLEKYRRCIPEKYHGVVELFHNSEARFRKCCHVNMTGPTFDICKVNTTLAQRRNTEVEKAF